MHVRQLMGKALAAWEDLWFHTVDARVYALVRMGFALVALINFFDMLPSRYELLASNGLMDVVAARSFPNTFSLYFWQNSPGFVDGSLLVFGLALLAVLLGWRTRLALALAYLWHLSYSNLALTALGGYDSILRNVNLILLVSPVASTWSLDARRRQGAWEVAGVKVPRYGLIMLQWQVLVIYALSFWNKAPDPYWRQGEAVAYFLMSNFAFFPHPVFAQWPLLNNLATYGTLFVELSVPFLLWGRRTRLLGFVLGWGLHMGIGLTRVYMFSLAMMVTYLAFLDEQDINQGKQWLKAWFSKAFQRKFNKT